MAWFKRKPEVIEATEEAYRLWLEAGRPDFLWFLSQPPMVQERLAEIGCEYTQNVCVAVGLAVKNPDAAQAGLELENSNNEVDVLRAMVESAAIKALEHRAPAPPAAPRPTMGGLTERRLEFEKPNKAAEGDLSLFGEAME